MADQGTGQQRSAGWKRDPSGRHYGRWWDGSQWTEHVISPDEVQTVDPLTSRTEPPEGAPPAWFGPVPAAPGGQPGAQRLRGPAPGRPPDDDPRGKGTNQVLATVRAWPMWAKWTVGIVATLAIIRVVSAPSKEEDQPVSVAAAVQTTLAPSGISSACESAWIRAEKVSTFQDTPNDYRATFTACTTVAEWTAGNSAHGYRLSNDAQSIARFCGQLSIRSRLCDVTGPPSTTAAPIGAMKLSRAEACRRFFDIVGDLRLNDDQSAVATGALAQQTADPALAAAIRRISAGFTRHAPSIPLTEINAIC